ncbi:MAG: YegP family protein [Planctomycetes bacterium]|nr:YegP family protein [Planctomycetota bacterium]
MTAKFEIFTGNDNQYYFHLKAENNEIIGHSEGYVSKQGAENGISSVKANAPHDFRYTIFQGRDSQYYFNLKAGNGEIILQSEGYVSKIGAQGGVASVKRNAPTAIVIDLTRSLASVR